MSRRSKRASPMVEKESEWRKTMRKELGAGPDGKGQEEAAEGSSGGEIPVKIYTKVLCCRVCFQPLEPPIFQCMFGHVICFQCHEKEGDQCHICGKATCYSRSVALEHFIDAIKVPCSNAMYGCARFIRYYQKQEHESTCANGPCFCPDNGCSFRGPTGSLLDHFVTKNGLWSPTNFAYNKSFKFSMARDRRLALFLGDDLSMFLLANTTTDIGNALTMVCVRPNESGPNYSCNISAVHSVADAKHNGRLLFQKDPLVSSSSLMDGVQLGKFFLLVPPELVDDSTDELTINICIAKLA